MVVFNGSLNSKPPSANLPLQFPSYSKENLKKPKTNDKSENWMIWFSMLSPFCSKKEPYLCINSAVLSHKMKKDKEESSFKFTMDRGHHYEGFVVTSILALFGSSLFSTGVVN